MSEHALFICHSEKQETALFSEKPIVICATGIQYGKTTVGAYKTKMAIHKFTASTDNFLITAPTYKIMQQSTLPAFMQIMEGLGEYSAQRAEFKVDGGGTVYFRTATDANSIVGVTNVRFIWSDEAGLYSLYFWENIQARAGFKEAQICLTSSPYSLNWLYKEFIRPKLKNPLARPDCELIQAASWENPFFPTSTVERARDSMDPRRFNMMFGGNFDQVIGLVYDCFDHTENQADQFVFPTGTRFFAGIDWGYTDPFVLLVHAILPNGKRYQVSETYRTGLTSTDIITLCKQKKDVFNIERFYCDPSQPGQIEELNRNGLQAVGATNDIRVGIDFVYELFKTRTLKLIKGSSPHTLDELETYHYPSPEDLKPDQNAKEQLPVGQGDHAMDSLKYLCIMTRNIGAAKNSPKVPDDKSKPVDQYKRLEQMKIGRGKRRGTEEWS